MVGLRCTAAQSVTPEVAARPEGAALTLGVRLIGLGGPAFLTARHVKSARARIATPTPTV